MARRNDYNATTLLENSKLKVSAVADREGTFKSLELEVPDGFKLSVQPFGNTYLLTVEAAD